ncbi:MAG: TonB-dependent receptor [Mucilaginibacter sp.]|uniref:TonB-dependent receptor domain-containing protein n=1 Tax=Mucilaginibacter sp. TaxID=1882438 RepID=UPI00326703A4
MNKALLFFAILFSTRLYAQQTIKGTVTDPSHQLLDAVTITLSQQNKMVASAFADHGIFTLKSAPKGDYILTATLIGYKAVTRNLALPQDSVLIIMQPEAKALKQVTISAAKPLIERKIDRVVFNVENSITASGRTVWDALGKAPGVQTKFDGGISASGKGVVIYLDDKPLRLSGDDLATYLRNLPSDNVSKMEIMTNPTARYDAQGGAVINIISKKPKGQGLNVILSGVYTQATYDSYNSSAVFNYRKGKWNIYGNYGYSRRKKDHAETEYVIYNTPGSFADWENTKSGIRSGNAGSYKLGVDYDLTPKQVIGFLVTGYNATNRRTNQVRTDIYNMHRATADSTLQTNNLTDGRTDQYSFNLNYKAKLDTNGRSLNIDLDLAPYRNNNDQYINNFSYLPNGALAAAPYRIFTPSRQQISIYSGKLDYTYKLGKVWSMESGLKYSSIVTENRFDFYNNAGATPVLITPNSDNFRYAEKTAAAYTSITGSLGKWTFEGGLRGEYTNTRGYSVTLDALNTNRYFKLFPTLFAVYKINKDNELNLNYGYRINRPDYWRLNPFKSYTSPYTYLVGNPALQPAFIHNIELGYTYKQQYNVALFLRRTQGVFSNITVQDDVNKIFYDTQQNLDLSQDIGISASFPVTVAPWWEINNYLQSAYRQEKSGYLQGSYNYHTLSSYLSTNHAFTINKAAGLKAEISAWYSSPSVQGIYHTAQTFDVSAGIRKTVIKGQGTLRLAVNDLFYGNAYRINVDYLNQHNGFYEKNDTRSVTLSFSYRLGSNVTAARKRNTASEDEKKRAN